MTVYPIQQTEGYPTRFQYGVVAGSRTLTGSADAISNAPGNPNYLVSGNWWISSPGVDAITLIAPVSGGGFGGASGGVFPALNGQDDFILHFVSTTAHAHTITTPANAINGSLHIATFGAAVANNISFISKSGVWYVLGTPVGVTLS